MIPPHVAGDTRPVSDYEPLPDWFIRDMGARVDEITPVGCWQLPIWPGFRLALKIIPVKGAGHV